MPPVFIMRSLLAALLVSAASASVHAQAPRITPAGDPSVKNDTIYSLAVAPGTHSDEPYILLLDDGVVRVEADGRETATYRQVIQIQTQDAAEQWGEHTFSYSAGREKLTINWIRVLKPNGEVISAKPTHEQESLAPVSLDAPVYSDIKLRRVTLGGVAPARITSKFSIEVCKMHSGMSALPMRMVLIPILLLIFRPVPTLGLCRSSSNNSTFLPALASMAERFTEQNVLPSLGR